MKTKMLQIGLILTGLVMIFIGVLRGEPDTVFHKAAMICMECIGIG